MLLNSNIWSLVSSLPVGFALFLRAYTKSPTISGGGCPPTFFNLLLLLLFQIACKMFSKITFAI